MFDNKFAETARKIYDGKRVHVIGRNALKEVREDFGFTGICKVGVRHCGPFGGTRYFLLVTPEEPNTGDNPYLWNTNRSFEVNTAADLDEVAKSIVLL